MELFNETKNNYFKNLTKLINEIINSKTDELYDEIGKKHYAVPKELIEEFFKNEIEHDQYHDLKLPELILDEYNKIKGEETSLIMTASGDKLINKKTGKFIYSYLNEGISILPCCAELDWLKTALEDEKAKLFFTSDELTDLKNAVAELNGGNSFENYITVKHEKVLTDKIDGFLNLENSDDTGENTGKYASNLNTMLRCIHENRSMKYSYKNEKGVKKVDDTTIPCKIEYSITNDELMLSSRTSSEDRPVKGAVRRFYNLEALDINAKKTILKELVDERKSGEPLVLRVTSSNDSDTLKRILVTFAKYNRNVTKNKDNSYTISITYYSFLEDNLINEIIAFGPKVVIESPHELREKMIKRISDPYNW